MKAVLKAIWQYFKKLDKALLLVALACSLFGVLLIYSILQNGVSSIVTPRTWKMQLAATGVGVVAALVLSALDYNKYAKLWFLYGPAAMGLVLLLFTPLGQGRVGYEQVDDRNWLNLGFMTIQPSEFLKIAFILSFAYHLSKVKEHMNHPKSLLLLCLHGLVPIGIIGLQGDYGTAAVFIAIFLFMLFTAGISFKYILAALIAAPVLGAVAWFFILQDLHRKRILVLLNPELDPIGIGNQQRQGKIALGSGQLFGKGLFGGEYSYVSEGHNDFIFSYVGQTCGFVGCMLLVGALCYISMKCIANSRIAKDDLGKLICIGVFGMIFTQSFLNVGMVLGVMPVIGIPLPFITSGGTAALSTWLAIGIVLSTYSHSKRNYAMFYEAD